MKVVFIAGTGRCGSTILDMVLGQLPSAVSVGELRYFWERGILQNRFCGSGNPFLEDAHWGRIAKSLYGSSMLKEAKRYAEIENSLRLRQMLGVRSAKKDIELKSCVNAYAKELQRVLLAIRDDFNSDLIIDSSKMPMHGFALAQLPDVDLRVIHLVRDRRAVVHSWNTSKFDKGKGGMMNTQSVRKASIEWELINRWIGRYLGDGSVPYRKVSYSDFTENPVEEVDRILEFIGEDVNMNPVTCDKSLNMLPTPSISGNPARFNDGQINMPRQKNSWAVSGTGNAPSA